MDIGQLIKTTDIESFLDLRKDPAEYIYLLKLDLDNNLEIVELSGLNQLLYYFNEDSLSGNDLVKFINEEYSALNQSSKQLEKRIHAFLTEALLYDKTLIPQ